MVSLIKKMNKKIERSETKKGYERFGTLSTSPLFSSTCLNTGKNFSEPTWKWDIDVEDFEAKMTNSKIYQGCPLHCVHEYKNKDGIKIKKLEANSLADLGSRIGISDVDEIIELQDICQRQGLILIIYQV